MYHRHRRHSSVTNKKQSEFELAIFQVAKEVEAKCDKLDGIQEEDMDVDSAPNESTKLQHKPQSDLNPKNVMKKMGRGKGRKKGKAKSLALNEIRRKYEQNAANIDIERNKEIARFKKRKSFNRVKLDLNVKSAAISGFKKKLKKQTQKDKMKEMLKNEDEAIKNGLEIVEELGFLKYLKDYEIYSRLLQTKQGKKGKRRRKRKREKHSYHPFGDDWIHKKSVSSIHLLREKKMKEIEDKKVMDNDDIKTRTKSTSMNHGIIRRQNSSIKVLTATVKELEKDVQDVKDVNVTKKESKDKNKKKSKSKTKSKKKGKLAAKFGNLNIDPTKMRVGAAPPKRIKKDDKKRGIDHSV